MQKLSIIWEEFRIFLAAPVAPGEMKGGDRKKKIPVSGDSAPLAGNPFAGLDSSGLPDSTPSPKAEPSRRERRRAEKKPGWRGRVDVRRESSGRGGKTVTVISGFQKISRPELEDLMRQMRRTTGSGGTLKEGRIELQGDRRDAVMKSLEDHGFRPVRAGG